MVKIHFAAFWVSFDPEVNFFRDSLLEGMDTVVTQDNPDIVFFSCFGDPQLDRYPNAKRVFFTGENLRPKPEADLSLSFDYDSSTNVRTPLYLLTLHELQAGEEEILYRPKEYDGRKLFCAFIYSHGVVGTRRGVYQDGVALRNRLFHALSKYKKVDSAGTFMNNMDMGLPSLISEATELAESWNSFKTINLPFPSKIRRHQAIRRRKSCTRLSQVRYLSTGATHISIWSLILNHF